MGCGGLEGFQSTGCHQVEFGCVHTQRLFENISRCCWHIRLLLGVNKLTAFFIFTLLHQAPTKEVWVHFSFFSDILPVMRSEKMEDNRRRKNKRADASKTGRRRLPADKQQQQQHQDLSGRQGECILLVEGKRQKREGSLCWWVKNADEILNGNLHSLIAVGLYIV